MYRWYQQATVCFAFLDDFDSRSEDSALKACRWFTMGWTLQELLAPHALQFYDRHWTSFGSRRELAGRLQEITGISEFFLRNVRSVRAASTAQRMFWASKRKTTRPEDVAYCLLGIFDVNLPLLYGEGGPKAFARLQRQILAQPQDDTIYCWHTARTTWPRGMLAESPGEFSQCSGVVRQGWALDTPPIITDQGVEIVISHWFSPNLFSWLRPDFAPRVKVPVASEVHDGGQRRTISYIVLLRPRYPGDAWTRIGTEKDAGEETSWITEMCLTLGWIFGRYDRMTERVTVALYTPTAPDIVGRPLSHAHRDLTNAAVVFSIVGLLMELCRASIVVAALAGPSATVDTSSDIIGHIVFGWLMLKCYWTTSERSISSGLGLLLSLVLLDMFHYGIEWFLAMAVVAFVGESLRVVNHLRRPRGIQLL